MADERKNLKERYAESERLLREARKEAKYYRGIAGETGRARLSFGAFWRYYLRQEPYEVIPHVRIWVAADKAAILRVKVPPWQLSDSGM